MSTIATPILQDNTLVSVTVTELFRGGDTYIRSGKYKTLVAEDARMDNLTVSNLIVNGTSTGTMTEADLGLSPNELVATNASAAPISFPYGDLAGQIVRRDANGSASFTSWVTPSTDTQFFFSTGGGAGIASLFNGVVDCVITIPDVGADANLVVYGNNGTSNVIESGDNILNLKSTSSTAIVALSAPSVATTRTSLEYAFGGTVRAKIVSECDTKRLSFRDAADIVRFQITPLGNNLSTISTGQALIPFTTDAWGLSNGNFNGFSGFFFVTGAVSSNDLTSTITFDSAGATVITLNATGGTSLPAKQSTSFTWNNTFITATTMFLCNVISLAGAPNAATVGVPHIWISGAAAGTCKINIGNIGTQTNSTAFKIGVMLFP